MSEDRRNARRRVAWFATRIAGSTNDAPERIAVTRDVSHRGALLLTLERANLGDVVTVTFQLGKDQEQLTAQARIVRVEPSKEDPEGLWKWRVGLEFLDARPELEEILEGTEREEI